ncbi:FAD-binding oxidoreductase [Actinokineospora xionganensis]|uniref:FAD-binding oxidoreductase n=1 Tax=Actinokineospora xionganensis TaxID=2684470 RepID=A0ABR7L1M6_9PSEU|nr:FAD-binding oxidoreductase [Actinokineospora xionganensis]MBC6446272.1 FAD-binding oxidoreductase [Actinokineospora xionganensis]
MGISRRTLLWAAGVGAATAACSKPAPHQPSTTPTTTAAPTRPAAVAPDWEGLRAKVAGLTQSGSPDYDTARRSYNTFFDRKQPAAVAAVRTPEQVQACVELARQSQLPIAARSGGHSYAGYSVPESGLVVDLRAMNKVDIQGTTATIGAGALLFDVYTALAQAGRCIPAGSCPSVGIAGLTLGGGVGVLSRKYGLTCDKLTAIQLVTADGILRDVTADADPDLFWALRGGGGGNFGIVTSFTFATDPAPDLVVFHLTFPAGAAPAVVGAWQNWVARAPVDLWSNCVIAGGSPPQARVGGAFVGAQATLNQLLETLLKAVGTRPTNRMVGQRRYLDAMRYFGGCTNRSCAPETQPREAFVASSRIITKPIGDPAGLTNLLQGRVDLDILLDSLGGAVNAVKPADTAFPHRDALATVQIYQKAAPDGQEAAVRAVAEVRDGVGKLGARGGYVNYIEAAMPDWGVLYYDANLSRLRAVARRYDPDRIFTFPQSIHRA